MIPVAVRYACAAVVALAMAGPAAAEQVRLQRVLLLPTADRSSIVFELSAPPQQVSTRRLSDSVLELEAGPGIDSAVPSVLKAPSNVRFVDSVTVRVLTTDAGPVIRARIALSATARAAVRSSGRRVYVDVSALPAASPPPARGPVTRVAASGGPPVPAAQVPAASSSIPAEIAYRDAVRPSIDRLRELGPFLASAAADPGVGAAVLPTLTSVRASMAALQPPDAARGSHVMVLGAVDRITRALAPEFAGNRAEAVRQSMTTIEVVGGVLVNPGE